MLYGQDLSKYIPPDCTWSQGTDICLALETAARKSYDVFSTWSNLSNHGALDAARMALLNSLDASQTAALKGQLDDAYAAVLATDTLIQEQAAQNGWDAPMPPDYVGKLRAVVEVSSGMQKTIDDWFSVSIGGALSDSIVSTVGGVSATVGNAVSKLAGSFIGATWWVWLLVGAGVVLYLKTKGRLFS